MNDPFDDRPTAGSTDGRSAGRWSPGRMAAIAVLVVLVLGGVGLALVAGRDADTGPVGVDIREAAGFYVPSALPDGWKVTALDVGSDDGGRDGSGILGCPCSITEFGRDGADGYITVTSRAEREALSRSDADRDPLTDLDGWYEDNGRSRVVVWKTADGSRAIVSEALDQEALEGLAHDWTEDEPPALDGYDVTGSRRFDHRIDEIFRVEWTISNASTGEEVRISLEPTVVDMSAFASSTVALPGNGLSAGVMGDEGDGPPVVGSWPPGALVTVRSLGAHAVDDAAGPVPPRTEVDTALTILGAFRPVEADAWSKHLTSVPLAGNPVTEVALDAYRTDRLSDWLVTNDDVTGTTDTTVTNEPDDTIIDVEPTTTTTMPTTTEPAEFDVEFADHEDPAAALEVTTDVRRIEVAPGEDFTIEVTILNRTGEALELDGCPFGSAYWEVDDGSGDPRRSRGSATGCGEDTVSWADGASQTKFFDFTAPDTPDQATFTAVIEFSSPQVTVTVPGIVTG